MAANGTPQSWLYAQGAGQASNQMRDRSMEQYYSNSGNPGLPMYNFSPQQGPQTGYGGQAYNYGRYVPPTMSGSGFNSNQWNQSQGPYSYNTPNSFGSNYMGGNFYSPYQSAQYGGGMNQPPGPFGPQGQGGPSFQSMMFQRPPQGGMQQGMGTNGGSPYSSGPTQGQFPITQNGGYRSQPNQGPGMWTNGPGDAWNPMSNTLDRIQQGYAQDPNARQGQQVGSDYWSTNKPMFNSGAFGQSDQPASGFRYGRYPANPDAQTATSASAPQFSPAFQRFMNMGY